MRQNTRVTFAMRDLDRLKCIQAVVDGDLKPIRAADRLGLTTRQGRRPRSRRACIGEFVQIDGCEYHWFEDRAPPCTALVYIDDASSRLMHILFTGTESTFGYFEATRQYLAQHGKPLAFYSDKASIFRVNHASATGGAGHTQFGRALYELNIDGICANTPAAKGRVERAHLTLQDRL